MKFKATFFMLSILIILSAYVYLVEIRGKQRRDAKEEKASRLLTMETEDIQSVTLLRDDENILIEREGDGWRLVSPVSARGDDGTIDQFIETISETKKEREIVSDDLELKEFGLLPPLYTVVSEAENGRRDTVMFGEKNPTNRYVFAMKPSDDRLFCTGTLVHSQLQKTVFDLRDKSVLSFETESVNRIHIQSATDQVILNRSGEMWLLEKPIETEADQQIVTDWLNDLHGARVERFEEETPERIEEFGIDKPMLHITLTIGSDNTLKELLIGKREDDVYFGKDSALPPIFAVDTTLVQDLDKGLFDFRDKTIVRFERDEVSSIEIVYSDRPHFFCQQGAENEWTILQPDSLKAKNWRISSLISDLIGMKAADFPVDQSPSLARYGFESPKIEVMLKNEENNVIAHLRIGNSSGEDDVFVMNRSSGRIYTTDGSIVDDLRFELEDMAENIPEVETTEN